MPICENCGEQNGLNVGGITWWPDFQKHLCEVCTDEFVRNSDLYVEVKDE